LVGAAVNDHVRAAGGEFENDGAANVPPRTRHEYGLAGKVEILVYRHAWPSLLCRRLAHSSAQASRRVVHRDPTQTTWITGGAAVGRVWPDVPCIRTTRHPLAPPRGSLDWAAAVEAVSRCYA